MPKSNQSQSSGSQKSQSSSGSGGRRGAGNAGKIDNVLYDVITVLHEKSKGLEAYERYEQDLQGHDEVREIFDEIRSNDEEAVQNLRECLRQLLSEEGASEEEEAA
jgi:hypothetical protein